MPIVVFNVAKGLQIFWDDVRNFWKEELVNYINGHDVVEQAISLDINNIYSRFNGSTDILTIDANSLNKNDFLQTFIFQYFEQHTLMWRDAYVRIKIPKSRYSKLVEINKDLKRMLDLSSVQSIYRVGIIRKVTIAAPAANSPKPPFSSLHDLVNGVLLPMVRFNVDFGDCNEANYPAKFVSNDEFTNEEFCTFSVACSSRLQFYPFSMSNWEVSQLFMRIERCRLSDTSGGSKDNSNIKFSKFTSPCSLINSDETENTTPGREVWEKEILIDELYCELEEFLSENNTQDTEVADNLSVNESLDAQKLRMLLNTVLIPRLEDASAEIDAIKSLDALEASSVVAASEASDKEAEKHQQELRALQQELEAVQETGKKRLKELENDEARLKAYQAEDWGPVTEKLQLMQANRAIVAECAKMLKLGSGSSANDIVAALKRHKAVPL